MTGKGFVMGNGNGLWKSISLVLIGLVLAGCGSWALFIKDSPSRSEVEEMVGSRFTENKIAIKELGCKLDDFKYQQAQMAVKVDFLYQQAKSDK